MKDDREARAQLVKCLSHQVPWLSFPDELRDLYEVDDNALDALIAALVARAAACGLCEPVPAEALPWAEREGWIALPADGSLGRLTEAQDPLTESGAG